MRRRRVDRFRRRAYASRGTVRSARRPLNPREAHAEILGSTVELELVAPDSMDGFDGFMIVPRNAKVRAADLNGQDTECSPAGVTHIPTDTRKKKYAVSLELPDSYGDVDLKVIALAKEREWYQSTMHIYVGEEPYVTSVDHSIKLKYLLVAMVCCFGVVFGLAIRSWPDDYCIAERHRKKQY